MSWKPSHVDNFRELCGFDAADGKKVKSGMIFRSGSLFNIKVKTLDKIHDKKGVSAVVDFRSDSETAEKPDTQTQSVGYYHIPPLTDEQNPSINRHNRLTVLNRICEKDGGAIKHLSDIYRAMISSDFSRESFHEFFDVLLNNEDNAVLFHCTQGKDRTGIGAAALLLALGVDKDDIIKDYLTTSFKYKVKNVIIFILVTIRTLSIYKARMLNQLLSAREEYINAAFDEIYNVFGSVDSFLHDGIGLTDDDLTKLRTIYLT